MEKWGKMGKNGEKWEKEGLRFGRGGKMGKMGKTGKMEKWSSESTLLVEVHMCVQRCTRSSLPAAPGIASKNQIFIWRILDAEFCLVPGPHIIKCTNTLC